MGITLCLSLTIPTLTQTPDIPEATSLAAPVAYIYVGTTSGVVLFDAASNGKLTKVAGSPFQTSGLAVGSNGKYFLSLGTNQIRSYPIASNGSIGKQVANINTQLFDGAECSDAGTGGGNFLPPAVLDHTGKNLYVYFFTEFNSGGPSGGCASIQTYNISTSGAFAFNGSALFGNNAGNGLFQIPSMTGNDAFSYASGYFGTAGDPGDNLVYGFKRVSSGELVDWDLNIKYPAAPNGASFLPGLFTADPTNHLAMATSAFYGNGGDWIFGPTQLASFTADAKGNLTSTNTSANMPTPKVNPSSMNMSPSGKLLAVAGSGLQVFHFNGAAPITPYSSILTTALIDRIRWDNSNHLYALSESTNKLYVYTVTPTSITQVAGSPYTVNNPNALIVVPK